MARLAKPVSEEDTQPRTSSGSLSQAKGHWQRGTAKVELNQDVDGFRKSTWLSATWMCQILESHPKMERFPLGVPFILSMGPVETQNRPCE